MAWAKGSEPPTNAGRINGLPALAVVPGHGTPVDASNRTTTNPLTGEPDAGDPPVRFGARGKVETLALPLAVALTAGWRPGATGSDCGRSPGTDRGRGHFRCHTIVT